MAKRYGLGEVQGDIGRRLCTATRNAQLSVLIIIVLAID